ncbi:cell division protein FtsN [Novosphingobium chloroacetimidivorans]|uniref:Cell division protein FtsN n=1 Tax=Novosphingobium chloroacetimidivorans TaxID=1428314 RepID=A0A7W7KBU5_9SPHN|nr:SPOR domain-containing protein [Novosphingobium chloroacetimidivorans]MBB4859901.1 cell division protein FtsN [Novosphingobium chloroacetimidivorans]
MVVAVRGSSKARLGTLVAAGLLAGITGVAHADVKAGVDAWSRGDFPGAVREWQAPAAAGDADAQFNLAQAYRLGRGVPKDLGRAEQLFGAAAAKGHLQASDNYGLLLFQRGERAQAMPYIRSAASRGDARAQYILGLALFNGDGMPKDWVRAYAYLTLAQQQGLPQASGALAQMDQHVSMADRQKSVAVASQIAAETEATRARQLAAVDLGTAPGRTAVDETPAVPASSRAPSVATVERAVAEAERVAGRSSPASAGADYTITKPRVAAAAPPAPARTPVPAPNRAPAPTRAPATARPVGPAMPSPAPNASGAWRVQLGAFGVAGNAEALWVRVRGRPELAGHGKLLVPAGRVTKLQAGGFTSQADAAAACARLKSAGFTCLATRD